MVAESGHEANTTSIGWWRRLTTLNQEINLTVYDRGVARQLEQIFDEDLKYSKPISYDEWKSRGIFERLIELFSFPLKEQL